MFAVLQRVSAVSILGCSLLLCLGITVSSALPSLHSPVSPAPAPGFYAGGPLEPLPIAPSSSSDSCACVLNNFGFCELNNSYDYEAAPPLDPHDCESLQGSIFLITQERHLQMQMHQVC